MQTFNIADILDLEDEADDKKKKDKKALNRASQGRIPNSAGDDLSPENRADYIASLLKKLQGYAPSQEQLEEEIGPSAGSTIGGASGSFPQSMAPLQVLSMANPGSKLIKMLLQVASTRRNEAGA